MTEKLSGEYQAVRDGVGLLNFSERDKVEVRGADRVSFLHAMITNDVSGLEEGTGCYGALLTARGKMVADFFYYRFSESILIDTQAGLAERLLETLPQYIVMDDVELYDVSTRWCHYSLQGPRAAKLLNELFTGPLPSQVYRVECLSYQGAEILLIRKDELVEPGYEVLVPREASSGLRKKMLELGKPFELQQIGAETYDVLRLEAGIARFGVDMDENRYPMEARLDEAISLTKGCYVGQEVVAKATHIGGVSNLLMGLRLADRQVPATGAAVVDEKGERVGQVTSAVYSPRFSSAIAFAYLKRACAKPGRQYRVELGEQAFQFGEVVESFD